MNPTLTSTERAAVISLLEPLAKQDLQSILTAVSPGKGSQKDVERLVVEAEDNNSGVTRGRLKSRFPDDQLPPLIVDLSGADLLAFSEARFQLVRRASRDTIEELHEYPSETRGHRGLDSKAQAIANRPWHPGKSWAKFFVKTLGLPMVFVGAPGISAAAPSEVIEPFRPLKCLRDFQVELRDYILDTLNARPGDNRAIMSLPTGAGKTRTAVEALLAWRLTKAERPSILWIAQSEELCEQAVQCFREVWIDQGHRSGAIWETLTIQRLWGNRTPPLDDNPDVVVASIQKLDAIQRAASSVARSKSAVEGFIPTLGAVVVDEAHRMEADSYQAVLAFLGINTGRRETSSIPLLGLTATPYRSQEDESLRLAGRFHNRLLRPKCLGADPIGELRQRRVLSLPVHEVMYYNGTAISIDAKPKYREYYDTWKDFHPELLASLGEERERNRQLVKSICEMPSDWPVLFFGCSVQHATAMAVLLRRRGRTAATVTGDTRPATRRFLIEEFRAGRISVLCNYGVLTTGFDAPRVRALVISRPTASPVLYEQMIGRGMRGPAFGGTEECLVIDVHDNIRFGDQMAYMRYESYWDHRRSS